MSNSSNPDREAILRLMDAIVDDVLEMTDEEFLADLAENGLDLQAEAQDVSNVFMRVGIIAKETNVPELGDNPFESSLKSEPVLEHDPTLVRPLSLSRTRHSAELPGEPKPHSDPQSGATEALDLSGRLREALVSLISIIIGPPSGSVQLGAAASHRTTVTPEQGAKWQSYFTLTWKQGEQEWSMEGRSRGDVREVVLACKESSVRESPKFIAWQNSRTGRIDHIDVRESEDGRFLVDIWPSRALIRVNAVRNSASKTEQNEKMPFIHFVSE